ncbi:MAG: replication-relaxation family protein, partial [Planctomycetes bacterium]|nr:replication-relaxation family protein [Planctomycetota bacterium]
PDAVASQIQRRFPQYLGSARTARRHLAEMQSLGYLAVAPTRGVSPLWPKVYYVTGRGVRKLRDALAAKGRPWRAVRVDRRSWHSQEGYSADHVLHEILLTEFLLAVWQTAAGRDDLELLKIERRSLARHPSFEVGIGGRRSRLIPDAMFLFHQQDRGMMCCYVEMDNGTMNRKQLSRKFQRYDAWSRTPAGQDWLVNLYRHHGAQNPRPMFRVLVVARDRAGVDDERRLMEVQAAVLDCPSIAERTWLTTVTDLQSKQNDRLPLDSPIWRMAQDTRSRSSIGNECEFPAANLCLFKRVSVP